MSLEDMTGTIDVSRRDQKENTNFLMFKGKSWLKMRGELFPMTQTNASLKCEAMGIVEAYFKVLMACPLYVTFLMQLLWNSC